MKMGMFAPTSCAALEMKANVPTHMKECAPASKATATPMSFHVMKFYKWTATMI